MATETVKRETEELYFPDPNNCHCWDAVIEVECGYDEPDPSVGWTGGPFIEGVKVVEYILTDDDGDIIIRLNPVEMEATNYLVKHDIDKKATAWAEKYQDSIFEEAGEQSQGREEAALEAKFDAMRESRMLDGLAMVLMMESLIQIIR